MKDESFTPLGYRHVWGGEVPFGIPPEDRPHHVYVIGKTGTGKSTFLWNLILDDIYAGRGVGFIDPHGDAATKLLDYIPPERTDDVVYFNPADLDFPIGLNLLNSKSALLPHVVASGIVNSFKSIWRDSWGPRLEYILYATTATLLECQNVSILGVQRLLTDSRYRQWAIKQVDNPMLQAFWIEEFERYDKRFLREAIAPIQNKVGQLLMVEPVRNILGQVRRTIDMRFMMDNKRIFIANLSKGLLGEEPSNLLGAMLVTQFQQAAMSRASIPENERIPFNLVIDEFQNFSTDSFASILSEARKYRLCLTLAHQFIEQIRPEIRDAVFGNSGTMVSFRVGHTDAAALYEEFGRTFTMQQFTELANYEVCFKPLVKGVSESPFIGRTMLPLGNNFSQRLKLIARSRERYGTKRLLVEDRLKRWIYKN